MDKLGTIIGKTNTRTFKAIVNNAHNLQYLQVKYQDTQALAQIVDLEKDQEQTTATCSIIGYRTKDNKLAGLRTPLEPNEDIYNAEDEFIEKVLNLTQAKHSANFGILDGREKLKVTLDLNKLLTKHVAVLAKSGSGKSYSVAVLLEEIIENQIPILIIDPHGEYSTLKYPNAKDKELLTKFNLKPKGYLKQVIEYSPDTQTNPEAKPLKLSAYDLDSQELIHLLPAKLNNTQMGLLYSAIKNLSKDSDFDSLIAELHNEENNTKYTIINIIEYMKKLDLFSRSPTSLQELIQPGKASIINLKGIPPDMQEVIVYKLMKDLFDARKKGNVPPFFAVIEEAHNYIPERNFGEAKSSAILRQIFAEGRKFGLGACIVTQRPSRIDKSCLSQCTTQIILKVTNPNDIKAISNSVEGITSETEKEIQNLPIGTAMVVGVVDLPLFVNVRPRKSKHGGEAVNMLTALNPSTKMEDTDDENFLDKQEEFGEVLNIIPQKLSPSDVKLMSDPPLKDLKVNLIPCAIYETQDYNLLVNLNNGHIIKDVETGQGKEISKELQSLSPQQQKVFMIALKLKEFTAAQIFSKSGMQFSDVYDVLNILTNKEYFQKEGTTYNISNKYSLLNELQEFVSYVKSDYQRIQYDNMLEKKYNSAEIKELLDTIVPIKNDKECYLVTYQKIL